MRIRRELHRPFRQEQDGIHFVGDVDAVLSLNVDVSGGDSSSVVRQHIVQRSRRTRAVDHGGQTDARRDQGDPPHRS